MPRRLVLLLLITALAAVLGFWSFTPTQAIAVVRYGGYWVVLASCILFGAALWRSLAGEVGAFRNWRAWVGPVVIAVVVAAFLHLHERHEFKIVADEVVLSLTGKQLHFAREASVTMRGYDYAGVFTPMGVYVDKRPLLFPFLLATVHDLTGFRPENVFALNAALSAALMLLLLLIGRRIGGWGAGITAVLLTATIPLVAQNACGAGFELLNLVMILLTLWLGMRAAEQPDAGDRLSAFVLSGVLLAQARYESVLFLAPIAAVIVYVWIRRRAILLPWPLLFSPLLLVLAPLQLNVFKVSTAAWQLNDIAGADRPFGLTYFYENVGHAMNFFLATDGSQPNSLLVAIVGVFGAGFFAMLLYREHREIFRDRPADAALAVFLVGLMVHTFFMLCYFWGHWDEPVIRRLSLPAHLLLVLAFVMVWPRIFRGDRRWTVTCAAGLLYLVAFTMPAGAVHRYTQQNFAARTTNWIGDFAHDTGDRNVLAIDRSAGLVWLLYGKSSIVPTGVADRPEAFKLHFRNHTFQDYYLVQRAAPVLPSGMRVLDAEDDFEDALHLQLIEERSFAPLYLVRLSRIVGVDEAKLDAWAKRHQERAAAAAKTSSGGTPATPPNGTAEQEQLLTWLRQLP